MRLLLNKLAMSMYQAEGITVKINNNIIVTCTSVHPLEVVGMGFQTVDNLWEAQTVC